MFVQAVSADQQQRIAGALVEALTDKDTGVGCDAAAALQQYGSTQQGQLLSTTAFSLPEELPSFSSLSQVDTSCSPSR